MKVLLTGASGFVGSAVVARLSQDNRCELICAVRRSLALSANVQQIEFSELNGYTDWSSALQEIQVVLHCAARVHVMDDHVADPLAEFRRVNVEGTLQLATQAAAAGVKRFVFVSSIKVNGEGTVHGQPYTADDQPAPVDPYGISKLEAEQGLLSLGRKTGMEVVIVRPVLVYGPGVKANFRVMMNWLSKGLPLPLGNTGNLRSMVALDNLVDLLITCTEHPAAANQVFLVSDGEDLSTSELLRRMGRAMGRSVRLFPVPPALLRFFAIMMGRGAITQRLCGSLQVDISKTHQLLDWKPPVSVDQALAATAKDFLDSLRS